MDYYMVIHNIIKIPMYIVYLYYVYAYVLVTSKLINVPVYRMSLEDFQFESLLGL